MTGWKRLLRFCFMMSSVAVAMCGVPRMALGADVGLAVEVEARGRLSPGYALFAQPGEELSVHLSPADAGAWSAPLPAAEGNLVIDSRQKIQFVCDGGQAVRALFDGLVWRAPQASGWLTLRFEQALARQTQPAGAATNGTGRFDLEVCVLQAFDPKGDGTIDGYSVGVYPNPEGPAAPGVVAGRPEWYRAPAWFIPITPETARLKVSPNFALGEFSPYEEKDKPHYIALDPRLVLFLETLRMEAEGTEGPARPVKVLRAFMSPHRRQLLERDGVSYPEFTRYQYGDAAAIVIDANGDGKLDDLNADGKTDGEDAAALGQLCEDTMRKLGIFGGIGVNRTRSKDPGLPDTPFVDVDLRGVLTRW